MEIFARNSIDRNYTKSRALIKTQHTNTGSCNISVQNSKERNRISEERCA